MIGEKFGKLTVESQAGRGQRGLSWWCRCDCGNAVKVQTYALVNRWRSCGCTRRDWSTIITAPTAEMLRTQKLTVVSWRAILSRCVVGTKKQACYKTITICDRWYDFANFFADMGPRPSIDYSIDRIDPDGNYEPSNCRWITKKENRSRVRYNRSPETIAKMSASAKQAYAEGRWRFTPEIKAKLSLKAKGRKMRECATCGSRTFLELCNNCRNPQARNRDIA